VAGLSARQRTDGVAGGNAHWALPPVNNDKGMSFNIVRQGIGGWSIG